MTIRDARVVGGGLIYFAITPAPKNRIAKRYLQTNVHSRIIYNSQEAEAPKELTRDEWIKKNIVCMQ